MGLRPTKPLVTPRAPRVAPIDFAAETGCWTGRNVLSKVCLFVGVVVLASCCFLGEGFSRSCVGGSPAQYYERADAVFTGAVANVDTTGWGLVVELSVFHSWKGIASETVTVRTSLTTVGVDFILGKEYLVYAESTDHVIELATDICDGTRESAGASTDLEYLGAPAYTSRNVRLWGELKAMYR